MKLVIIRHGESLWNAENRFTGWTDVDLSEKGIEQAKTVGGILRESGQDFDIAFTSVLLRAIRTMHIVLEEMGLLWIPEEKSWRLNERFYGALQGMDKHAASRQFGSLQVEKWRRGINDLPPEVSPEDGRYPGHDPRYGGLSHNQLPVSESLSDTLARVLPFWEKNVLGAGRQGKKILIVSHGNTIRALCGHFMRLNEEKLTALEIPYGVAMRFELDAKGFAAQTSCML